MPWDPAEQREYHEDLSIDPGKLDEEWLEQAHLYMHYAGQLAHAKMALHRAKENVKTTRSKLILEAKSEAAPAGKNPTAQVVEAYYRTHEDYMNAKAEEIEAEFDVNVLEAGVFAMHQRKTALENEVRLCMGEYFAGPVEPRDLSDWSPRKAKQIETAKTQRQRMRRGD